MFIKLKLLSPLYQVHISSKITNFAIKILSNMTQCLICNNKEATKTNSHIIPSFLVARICSYDNSGKRDKDVIFSFDYSSVKLHIGQLPSDKIDELLCSEDLTDERINDLKKNPVSTDYILCPECEKMLGEILEAPYARFMKEGKQIDPDVAYYFWLSILYRISITRNFQFSLPKEIEKEIGESLHQFLEAKSKKLPIDKIINNSKISYQLLKCPDFLPKNSACMYAELSSDHNVCTLVVGDIIVSFSLGKRSPNKYSFYGIENILSEAPTNYGIETEHYKTIAIEDLKDVNAQLMKLGVKQKIEFYRELTNRVWSNIGLKGTMPEDMLKYFLETLCSNDTKLGERHTMENIYETFQKTLDIFGYKLRNQ